MTRQRGHKVWQCRGRATGKGNGCERGSGKNSGGGHIGLHRKMGMNKGLYNLSFPRTPLSAKEILVQQNATGNRREELKMNGKQTHTKESQALSGDNKTRETGKEGEPLNLVAVVDAEACIECGACDEVCPENAISMDETAIVDQTQCTGCGLCLEECPTEAISLQEVLK